MLSVARHRRASIVALMALVVGVGVVPSAPAQNSGGADQARPADAAAARGARAQAPERSLSDAVRRVQRTTGGRILGAERVPFDGRDINRVKYMDDRGRVRYMDDPSPTRSTPRAPRNADAPPRHGDNP